MMSIFGSFETDIRGSLGEIPLFEVRIYSLAYTQGSHLDMEIAGEGIIIPVWHKAYSPKKWRENFPAIKSPLLFMA